MSLSTEAPFPLAEAFFGSHHEQLAALHSDVLATHERALRSAIDAATETWPELHVEPKRFAAFLGRRAEAPAEANALSTLRVDDLYLAFACTLGDESAIAAFERRYLTETRAYVGRIDGSEQFVDEVRQLLREKLFV